MLCRDVMRGVRRISLWGQCRCNMILWSPNGSVAASHRACLPDPESTDQPGIAFGADTSVEQQPRAFRHGRNMPELARLSLQLSTSLRDHQRRFSIVFGRHNRYLKSMTQLNRHSLVNRDDA